MKKLLSLLLISVLTLSLAACGTGGPSGDVNENGIQNLKVFLSCNGTELGNDTKAAREFERLIEERSDGAVQIEVYNNDQLAAGDMAKGIELVMNGAVQIDCHSTSILANLNNNYLICTMPWAFSSWEEAEDIFWSTGFDYLDKLSAEKGLTYLGATHNGFKVMTCSKKQIIKPEDLKGLKIRIPGGEYYSAFYASYGASPQAMSWSEVFSALQQGTIDGHDNSMSTCVSNNIPEVQKYFTVSHHTYEAFNFTANRKWFESLNAETQALIRECMEEACKTVNAETAGSEAELIEQSKEKGCEFYEFTDEDIETWKGQLTDLIAKYKDIYGPEACEAFHIQ